MILDCQDSNNQGIRGASPPSLAWLPSLRLHRKILHRNKRFIMAMAFNVMLIGWGQNGGLQMGSVSKLVSSTPHDL